jgi:hypothetical protein
MGKEGECGCGLLNGVDKIDELDELDDFLIFLILGHHGVKEEAFGFWMIGNTP